MKPKVERSIKRAVLVLVLVFLAFSLWFGYNLFSIWRYSSSKCMDPSGAIVVMGAAEYNGVPSEVLSARINTAASLYQKRVARYVIALGGSRKGDLYSEGEVGKVELMRDSVPKEDAFSSSRGQDTYQSMAAAMPLLRRLRVRSVIIVSDGFHLFRSVTIARSLGVAACGYSDVGSPIQGGLKFDYMLRETVAVTVAQVIGYKEESIIRHGQE